MTPVALKDLLAGAIAFACVVAVVLFIALDAEKGLGPAGVGPGGTAAKTAR